MKSTDENKDGEGEKAVLKEPTKLDIPTKVRILIFGGGSVNKLIYY